MSQTARGRGKPLPYSFQETLPGWGRGGPWASRRDSHRERWLGKARRSSGTATILNFANPGPVARKESLTATQIFRAGNFLSDPRGNPVNGGPGVSGPMGTKCPSAASPGDPLGTFPSCRFTMQVQQ